MKKSLLFLFVLSFLYPSYTFAQTCITPSGGSINGPNTGCTDRVAIITVTGVSNATSYNWDIKGASFSKVTDTEYNIVFGTSDAIIKVTPINATNGPCSGAVITKTIIVTSSPAKPTITQTGTTLTSSSSLNYQWYLGTNPIGGANAITHMPTQNGTYYVESKNANGCGTFSDAFTYFTTAIREDAKFKSFSFYPNPVETSISTVFTEKYNLEFFDISGRKVLESKNLNGEQKTDLSFFNKGIYMMRITSGDKKATRKIILK